MGSKGRRFSDDFKHQVVREVLSGESQGAVSRRHGLAVNTVSKWVKAYRSGRLGEKRPAARTSSICLRRTVSSRSCWGRKSWNWIS